MEISKNNSRMRANPTHTHTHSCYTDKGNESSVADRLTPPFTIAAATSDASFSSQPPEHASKSEPIPLRRRCACSLRGSGAETWLWRKMFALTGLIGMAFPDGSGGAPARCLGGWRVHPRLPGHDATASKQQPKIQEATFRMQSPDAEASVEVSNKCQIRSTAR